MKYRNLACAALLCVAIQASFVSAQRTRTGAGQRPAPKTTAPARPAPTPTPSGAAATQTPPPGTLATVNGQAITLTDLDPQVRQVAENFDKNIPALRKDALDARINTLLVESEAQKRKVTKEQLLDAEINNRVPEPTEAEIKAVYDANKQQIGDADISVVRPQIVSYLKGQSVEKLSNELVTRLRTSHTVVMGTTDVNAPNLAPSTVFATVDGKAITASDFDERLKPLIYKMRSELYQAEARAVDTRINQTLLEAEAKKRNQTPEAIFKAEVVDKLHEPTDAEVTKFYEDNKARIKGELATLRNDIISLLKDQQQNRLESEFVQRLRSGVPIQIFLKEPEAPTQIISVDDDPARGDANSVVTVVEFTDFQCPACSAMQPVLEEVLKTYGNRVRFVVRDFPLSIHENARKAAEAANAAAAQGKFFEYVAVLFKNQSALDNASLKKYATDLGLDRAKFDAALDSGQYATEVSHDVADGESYGVEGTPTIFINGVRLRNLTAEGLRVAIEGAFSAKGAAAPQKRAAN